MKKITVKEYIDQLQSSGRYSFQKPELLDRLNISIPALNQALNRLIKKHRIAMIRQGFYIIIPLEYHSSGILPVPWFIHQLMNYLDQPYYVALLSAAAIHGAAHQQPQEFQVITDPFIRAIQVNGLKIKFFQKCGIALEKGVSQVKTESGHINVSTPGLTAIDLLRYVGRVGGLDRVTTVLLELAEKIDPKKLAAEADMEKSLSYIQRLGLLLDILGFENLTVNLHDRLKEKKPEKTALEPGKPFKAAPFNVKWQVYVNREVEPDSL